MISKSRASVLRLSGWVETRVKCTWVVGMYVCVCVCVYIHIYDFLPNTWGQMVLTITKPDVSPPLTILTLIKFVWLNLLQSEIHLWDLGIESWTLGKTEKEKMDNDSNQSLSIYLPARTTSGWFMYITTNSITLLDRWHTIPTLQMNTMQPPKPGEVICPGGVAREVLGCQPRLNSNHRQCFPQCLSAPSTQRKQPQSSPRWNCLAMPKVSWIMVLKIREHFDLISFQSFW